MVGAVPCRRHQQDNFIHQKIVGAVPLRRIYVSQTLFELVLVRSGKDFCVAKSGIDEIPKSLW